MSTDQEYWECEDHGEIHPDAVVPNNGYATCPTCGLYLYKNWRPATPVECPSWFAVKWEAMKGIFKWLRS